MEMKIGESDDNELKRNIINMIKGKAYDDGLKIDKSRAKIMFLVNRRKYIAGNSDYGIF